MAPRTKAVLLGIEINRDRSNTGANATHWRPSCFLTSDGESHRYWKFSSRYCRAKRAASLVPDATSRNSS